MKYQLTHYSKELINPVVMDTGMTKTAAVAFLAQVFHAQAAYRSVQRPTISSVLSLMTTTQDGMLIVTTWDYYVIEPVI